MKKSSIEQIVKNEIDPAFARRARLIMENLGVKNKGKLLEVGCGRGFYLKSFNLLYPDLKITGVDLNNKYLNKAGNFIKNDNVKLIQGDATKLPFLNDTFDWIIASEILEHIPDDTKALSELYRVLKPGGKAVITVPNKNYPLLWDPLNWVLERIFHTHLPANIWWLSGIWADHVRLYSKKELKAKLQKSGFSLENFWMPTHYCLPFSHFLLYGIGKNLIEFGLFKNMDRFSNRKNKPGVLKKIILLIIGRADKLNTSDSYSNSVNLVALVKK